MAKKALEYKGHPLRRKDNLIYFGDMALKYERKPQAVAFLIHSVEVVSAEAELVRGDTYVGFHHRRSHYRVESVVFEHLVKLAKGA